MPKETEKIVIESLNSVYQVMGMESTADKESLIYGTGDGINSLSLLLLIVTIEENIMNETGKKIVLAYDRATKPEDSPFYSVKNLSAFIEGELSKQDI
jgi:hypothetical protein